MKSITVYTDGSCYPNPGFGAWSAVVVDNDREVLTLSGTQRIATNNQMELMGVIRILATLEEPCIVTLHSDSQYVVNAINSWMAKWQKSNWQRKQKGAGLVAVKNADLFQQLMGLRKPHQLRAVWVRGHSGDKWNEYCDMVASELVSDYYRNK